MMMNEPIHKNQTQVFLSKFIKLLSYQSTSKPYPFLFVINSASKSVFLQDKQKTNQRYHKKKNHRIYTPSQTIAISLQSFVHNFVNLLRKISCLVTVPVNVSQITNEVMVLIACILTLKYELIYRDFIPRSTV